MVETAVKEEAVNDAPTEERKEEDVSMEDEEYEYNGSETIAPITKQSGQFCCKFHHVEPLLHYCIVTSWLPLFII